VRDYGIVFQVYGRKVMMYVRVRVGSNHQLNRWKKSVGQVLFTTGLIGTDHAQYILKIS
jgi:hypothetical protein